MRTRCSIGCLLIHYVDGKSWTELAANYAIWRGRLWPLVLLAVVLAPFLWGHRRGRADACQRSAQEAAE